MNKKSMNSTVALLMAITLLGKLLAIVRDRMQGAVLGADTPEGIAFMAAASLPRNFFDVMFASVFSASFIPIFNKYLETKGRKEAFDLASLFITVMLAMTAAITVICVVFASPLYGIFLSGGAAGAEVRNLAVPLMRILFPLIVLSGLAFSLTGVLQSLGEFKIPAAMSVISNGIIILYYFVFSDRYGVWGLAVAFLIGWLTQALVQIPFLIKNKFPFRFRFNLKDGGLREIAMLTLPVIAASWLGPVNLMVGNKTLLMSGGEYDLVGFGFANNIYTIASGVFVLTVANVVFPKLSKQVAGEDKQAFNQTLWGTVGTSVFFLLPISLGLSAVSVPVVRLMYEEGLFGAGAVEVTAESLRYFSFGILGYGLQIIASRACYALKDGKSPAYSSLAAIAVNAVLCFTLARSMGAAGTALASAISLSFAAAWLLIALWKHSKRQSQQTGKPPANRQSKKTGNAKKRRKKGQQANEPESVIKLPLLDLFKMLFLALLTYLTARGCLYFLPDEAGMPFATKIICAAVPTAMGAAVYLGGAWLLKLRGYMNWKA